MDEQSKVSYLPLPERIMLPNVRPTAHSTWTEPPRYSAAQPVNFETVASTCRTNTRSLPDQPKQNRDFASVKHLPSVSLETLR
jgi:hypothetical protein